MANAARGESELVAGGQSLLMRLTLGALSEIEDGLGGGNLGDINSKLQNLATKDIALVASALLRGGGHNVSPSEVMKLETDVGSLVGAITGAFGGAGQTKAAPPAATPSSTPAPVTNGTSAPLTGAPSSNSASA